MNTNAFFLPACMLINKATGRFHPIIFTPYLMPGGAQPQGGGRFKSHGHHTDGFDTLEAAWEHVKKDGRLRAVERTYEWDGVEMPAMVEFFGDDEGKPGS
jgi:hypothetical protein